MPRALVVLNPAASGARRDAGRLTPALRLMRDWGWSVDLQRSVGPGTATALARAAVAAGYEMVVAAGGDGTINEIIQALARSDTILGVLPLGMVNLWAYEAGIPSRADAAALVLVTGQVRRVDLGVASWGDAEQRYFLLMAGIGLDAEAVRRTEPSLKRRIGPLAYLAGAVRAALAAPGASIEVDLPSETLRRPSMFLLAGNTRCYAGRLRITSRARADDSLLDLCFFPGHGLWRALRYGAELLAGCHLRDPAVIYRVAPAATVRSQPTLPVQLDGELAGTTPVALHCAPQALRVIVPTGSSSALFSSPQPAGC